ncbi:methyltransferase domain-containing protein [Streptomyces mayteni]
MTEAQLSALRQRLTAALAERGAFREPWLREVFDRVPRHAFVPETVWRWTENGWVPLQRGQNPALWAELVYHPTEPLITQVDDGDPTSDSNGREPTSSISAAGAVLNMLASLDPQPGQRVLEVGTGTGYNAALLCERVGESHVVTVEVDGMLSDEAAKRLAAAGYHPQVVRADGEHGYPAAAPYDRLICTASVRTVPVGWLDQMRPGGEIVAPWFSGPNAMGLIWLRVRDDGTARGRFHGTESFMPLRGHRSTHPSAGALWEATGGRAVETVEDSGLDGLESANAAFAFRVLLPGVACYRQPAGWFFATEDETSWAGVTGRTAHRFGPRDLIAEARAALAWWGEHGEPSVYDFGITVTADTQTVWLREETHRVAVVRPAPRPARPAS